MKKFELALRHRLSTLIAPPDPKVACYAGAFYEQQPSCQIPELYYLLEKFLGRRSDGQYVEVGAYDGIFASNTWGLAKRGWQGVLIEPLPDLAQRCRENYARYSQVSVLQSAVGAHPGTLRLHLAGPLTTANSNLHLEYTNVYWARESITSNVVEVECKTLDQIIEDSSIDVDFDLLVVDVEGFETEVFEGFSLKIWKPKMLIVELSDSHPDLKASERQDALLAYKLVQSGYVIVFKDAINTLFVRRDIWKAVYAVP